MLYLVRAWSPCLNVGITGFLANISCLYCSSNDKRRYLQSDNQVNIIGVDVFIFCLLPLDMNKFSWRKSWKPRGSPRLKTCSRSSLRSQGRCSSPSRRRDMSPCQRCSPGHLHKLWTSCSSVYNLVPTSASVPQTPSNTRTWPNSTTLTTSQTTHTVLYRCVIGRQSIAFEKYVLYTWCVQPVPSRCRHHPPYVERNTNTPSRTIRYIPRKVRPWSVHHHRRLTSG